MFPLNKKKIFINAESNLFLNDYTYMTEIPIREHPGSFGFVRKNHIHEGIDIYCNNEDTVYAMEAGVIVKIIPFTGKSVGSDWWNDTYAVLVKHKNFYINYGELLPNKELKEGMLINEGFIIGNIEKVLKKDKGRPMSMLHLEMYNINAPEKEIPIKGWNLNTDKPNFLLNPTEYLLTFVNDI